MYYLLGLLFVSFAWIEAATPGPSIVEPHELAAHELARLNLLIEATERSLQQQKRLRENLQEYQKLQVQYLQQPEDNELLYQLIKTAYVLLESIKGLHLETCFEPEFLSELTILA